ncbi:restriction endonuclease subunit S [Adlercreutzia equolifaciens]|uniref:Restriction endonuclease subunit S n=1 Tax=Adlercreutzia equolifaciens TaxID=446660 RepID=A0A6L8Q327_9ACTN|nr:restriction endonuclease subunit S [Adlercreutzia equolifaciens]MZG27646.1 restriction endonuclease subunit S [Adlercreutzia equolifaciens]
MEEQRKSENALVPALRFEGFSDPWEQRRLGEVVDVRSGRDYKHLKPGLIPVYGTGGLMTYVNEALSKNEDAIGIGRKGTIDQPYKLYAPFWTVDTLFYAIPKIGIDIEFALSCFLRINWKAKDESTGLPSLSKSAINDTRILLPDAREQSRIGTLFSKLDSLIALHQRKHEKLKTVKQSLLEKMFPKEGEDVPEIRFEGFTDPWEQRRLGEICDEVTRRNPLSEAPVMMITAESGFIEQSERYSTDNAGESLQKYIVLRRGELAYNHGASKLRPFGSCFNLLADEARIPFVYHCFSLRSDCPAFTSLELNGGQVEDQLRTLVSSGARMDGLLNISFEEYQTVRLLLPSLDEQRQIAGLFAKLDSLIALHQRELDILKNLKQALLEKMFV